MYCHRIYVSTHMRSKRCHLNFVFHRRESHTSLEKTLGRVNDDRGFIFGWSVLLKPIQVKSNALLTATVRSFMRKRTSPHLIWEQPDEQKSLKPNSRCHKPFDVDFLTMRAHQECRIAQYLIGHSNSSCDASGVQTYSLCITLSRITFQHETNH